MKNDERLLQAVQYFTRETQVMSGMAVVCGTGESMAFAGDGEGITAHAVYDLASLTKLMVSFYAMALKERGLLDLKRPLTFYEPRFRYLKNVTLEDVMGFQRRLETPGRVTEQKDIPSALQCYWDIADAGPSGKRAYSDMPAMVAGSVLEAVGGCELYEGLRQTIFEPAGMKETWMRVPEERLQDCLSYDGEYRIEGEKQILRTGLQKGIPHDPKAAMLQTATGRLCGHAGLFSTIGDMTRFCRAVLERKIVKDASLAEMARNRTGRQLPDGSYSQYLGLLCYVKHPVQYYSEIPLYMSDAALGISGFTGNHLALDPVKNRFSLYLGNRVKDRLTTLVPPEGKNYGDYGLLASGLGKIRRPDGRTVPSSVNYVHQKDEHLHRVIAEIMGWETGLAKEAQI